MKLFSTAKQDLINDYKTIPKTVLADLKKRAPLMQGLDIKGGVDANTLLVLQGRSDVVIYIYKMIGLDPYAEREEKAIS